jgi:hypothetical protein
MSDPGLPAATPRATAGLAPKFGGSDAGADPGVFGCAAVGACLAVGYGMWGARLGVPIDALDEEDVRRVLDTADRYSPRLDDPARRVPIERVAEFTRTER